MGWSHCTRGGGAHTVACESRRCHLPSAALQRAVPVTPVHDQSRDVSSRDIGKGYCHSSRPFPLPVAPDGTGAPRALPRLRGAQLRMPGQGRVSDTGPGSRRRHQGPPQRTDSPRVAPRIVTAISRSCNCFLNHPDGIPRVMEFVRSSRVMGRGCVICEFSKQPDPEPSIVVP